VGTARERARIHRIGVHDHRRRRHCRGRLEAQRKFWQFVGVLSVIMILFMVAGIVLAIVVPAMMRAGAGS
jgi:hypothetical protein